MATVERSFHLFPKLPTELRLEIWRRCLPHRVYEICKLDGSCQYAEPGLSRCELWPTSIVNSHPPAISRICRESRQVAFETGNIAANIPEFYEHRPQNARWVSQHVVHDPWIDTARDSIHLNWTYHYFQPGEDSHEPWSTAPWCLAWEARLVPGDVSVMGDLFETSFRQDEDLPGDFEVVKSFPHITVVMHVVSIHADFTSGAATGLFGLLGDAPVQIVDVRDAARIDAFWDLAEKTEPETAIPTVQKLRQKNAESHINELKKTITALCEEKKRIADLYAPEEFVDNMHPAVMFRLCTQGCDPRCRPIKNLQGEN